MNRANSTRSRAQKEAEAARALELHTQGKTERQIAQQMTEEGIAITQPTVHRRIQMALELYVKPALEETRTLELARIETLFSVLAPAVARGDVKAVAETRALMDRKAKMLGLDKPTESKVTVEAEDAEAALQAQLAQARAARKLHTV